MAGRADEPESALGFAVKDRIDEPKDAARRPLN